MWGVVNVSSSVRVSFISASPNRELPFPVVKLEWREPYGTIELSPPSFLRSLERGEFSRDVPPWVVNLITGSEDTAALVEYANVLDKELEGILQKRKL